MTYEVLCITSDNQVQQLMRSFDLFDPGKFIYEAHIINVITRRKPDKILAELNKLLSKAVEVLFLGITNDEKIAHKPVFKKGVRALSTGSKWMLFKDKLESYGFTAETDDNMIVTNVISKQC